MAAMTHVRAGMVAVMAVVVLASPAIHAQPIETSEILFSQPSGVLVMPFDVTGGRASFQIVSRIGAAIGGEPLQTHWVFWSADCRHLADVFIGLTGLDTVVVDASRIQPETQLPGLAVNQPQGPVTDLTGERGVVIVTAIGSLGGVTPQIVGGWTIADGATGTSFGSDAIGISQDGTLPSAERLAGGVTIPTFNTTTLTRSQVILIGLEADGGSVRPITRASQALFGAHVCCETSVTDNLEVTLSTPDVCFDCVGFAALTPELASSSDRALLPVSFRSSGLVHLSNCRSADRGGDPIPLGSGTTQQFLLALHGQAVGPFSFVLNGKYSGRPPI